MSFDLNDAEPQKTGELIPDGTFAKVAMVIRPGGIDGEGEIDRGLLKRSGTPGQRRADARLRVHRHRGPVRPPQVLADASPSRAASSTRTASRSAAKITKSTLRAMIDSALGLDPEDMSEAAKAKRILRGFADLNGHHLRRQDQGRGRAATRPTPTATGSTAPCVPTEPEWRKVMNGEAVPARPSGSAPPQAPAASGRTPAPARRRSGRARRGPGAGGLAPGPPEPPARCRPAPPG